VGKVLFKVLFGVLPDIIFIVIKIETTLFLACQFVGSFRIDCRIKAIKELNQVRRLIVRFIPD